MTPFVGMVLAVALVSVQEEKKLPEGHSTHGEAFNEGPRQAAFLMEGTGRVRFGASTKNGKARKFIDQGIGQLHGFWYFEAERSFRQAAALDPDCAIAYWGMAMANQNNEKRAKGFIAEAVKRKDKASKREAMYVDALAAYVKAGRAKRKDRNLAYTKALEKLLYEYPDDLEAKAFLCLQFYNNKNASIPVSYLASNALMEQVLAVEPLHPVHHYRIHLWDREKPEKALDSAAQCGQASPAIAHMWHMPGHIYSRLKRYGDAAWQQEASARVDHAQMIRDRLLPDQIHNFAHNNEWFIRNLIHVGRARESIDLSKNMISLPRHPKYNTLSRSGSTRYGRMRLFQTLSQFELWDRTIELCNSPILEPTEIAKDQIERLRRLGRAYYARGDAGRGDLENGDAQLALLEKRLAGEEAKRDKAAAEAEEKAKKAGKDVKKARDAATRRYATPIKTLKSPITELMGWSACARGEFKEAADLLKKAGRVDPMALASVRLRAGDAEGALKAAVDYVGKNRGECLPLAQLVALQKEAGKDKEAGKSFEKLRSVAATADLDTPPFARLKPIADAMGLPSDWRLPPTAPADLGVRPELDSLGPFRWSPPEAPDFTLKDSVGKSVSLRDYRGKPVLVIFYLGYACLHCVEQLQAFGPRSGDFEKAGISMVAVSSDDLKGLGKSVKNYDKGDIPFPLLSDPSMDVFKRYRAYDDFERQPLHGTFLIDGRGRDLWHDVSYDPFMDADFVLKEAARLLAQEAH